MTRPHFAWTHFGPATDGNDKVVGKAAKIRRRRRDRLVAKTAEQFLVKHVFRHAVVEIEHRHSGPADAERRVHMGLGPVDHFDELVPVGDVGELEMFDGSAGDDQPVELLRLHLLERTVKGFHVTGRRILRPVERHADQGQFDLQGSRTDHPGELRLGLDLFRHQVDQPDPKRPNVLADGPSLGHDHDALVPKDIECREFFWDGDWHRRQA